MDQNQQPQNQPAPQPAAAQPMPAAAAPVAIENPGQTLGIISIVATVLGVGIAGIILGVMSRNKSKAAGMSTTLGTVGLVLGIIATALGALFFVFWIILVIAAAASGDTSSMSSSSALYN